MPEKTLPFWERWERKQYIPPEYKEQIESFDKKQRIAKGKKIGGAMAEVQRGQLVKGLAHSLGVAQDIREEIKAGDTSSFPYLLGLAILVDIVDFVPIVGTIVQVVAWPILFWGTFMRGRLKYKTGVRMLFYVLNFVEIIPFISWLPLETLSILLLWRATAKMRQEKETEEADNDQLIDSWGRKLKQQNRLQQRIEGEVVNIEKEIGTGIKNQPQINKQAA